jgi:hypothetical protein
MTQLPMQRIAVVGAGWAGLACARLLADAGCTVEVFEAAPQAGGRARGVTLPLCGFRARVDNGQHLLIGAYSAVRRLLALHGNPAGFALQPAAFNIARPGARPMRLGQSNWLEGHQRRLSHCGTGPKLPAPLLVALRQASWIIGSKGLPLRWVWGLRRLLQASLADPPGHGQVLGHHLRRLQLPLDFVRGFVASLAESALNTSVEQACAARFSLVLQEAFGGMSPDSAYFLTGAGDLSSLLPEALIAKSPAKGSPLGMRYGTRLTRLERCPASAAWWLRTDRDAARVGPFDQVVLAIRPDRLRRLMRDSLLANDPAMPSSSHGGGEALAKVSAALCTLPDGCGILTRWLALGRVSSTLPVLALPATECTPGRSDQQRSAVVPAPTLHSGSAWVFPRPKAPGLPPAPYAALAGLVVSAINDKADAARIADRITAELGLDVVDHFDVYERQAATPSVAGLTWPAFDLCGAHRLWLAGDWVGDGSGEALPATLESAVRSAFAVAKAAAAAD